MRDHRYRFSDAGALADRPRAALLCAPFALLCALFALLCALFNESYSRDVTPPPVLATALRAIRKFAKA